MLNNLILKKLEQISILLGELKELLGVPFLEFKSTFRNIRSKNIYHLSLEIDLTSVVSETTLM
ncbi:MAG: hypothetical protein Q8Q03_01905 [bacterium]|nr:hypothetical protein [bacterium]